MPKVTAVQVIYNSRRFIEPVFSAIFSQTFKDMEVVAVIAANDDGGRELLAEKFPRVKIIDPGFNIGFAGGHNLVFEKFSSDFFQLVNPDFVMEPNYIEEMLKAFEDEKVGAATGKLYQFKVLERKIEDYRKNKILDSTGVVIAKSGRAYDRGQHEPDSGQYDARPAVQAVCAAGAMYKRSALLSVKYSRSGGPGGKKKYYPAQSGFSGRAEFFDESFHSYWEDVDLSWRMANAGFKCVFQPSAVGYHGRAAGSSRGGYKKVWSFVKFHQAMNPEVRKLNYKNHILMYLKNSPVLYPQFFIRELFMFFYILAFEPGTLKILPELFKSIPAAWCKRRARAGLSAGPY